MLGRWQDRRPDIADDKRNIMREVALTYRRETRAAQAEGAKPPEWRRQAYEAARAKYVGLDPDAPADRLAQSRIVHDSACRTGRQPA